MPGPVTDVKSSGKLSINGNSMNTQILFISQQKAFGEPPITWGEVIPDIPSVNDLLTNFR